MSDHNPATGAGPLGVWRRLKAGTRIAILVLLAFLPLIAIHILSIVQIDQAQRQHIEHDVADLAHVVSQAVVGSIDAAQASALALSDTATLKAQEPIAAGAALQELLAQRPGFVEAWAAAGDGRVYAAALPLPPNQSASVAGEPYFQQALATGRPVLQTVRGIPQHPDLFAPLVAVDDLIPGDGVVLVRVQLEPAPQRLNRPGVIAAFGVHLGEVRKHHARFPPGGNESGEDALGPVQLLQLEANDGEQHVTAFGIWVDFHEPFRRPEHVLIEFVLEGLNDQGRKLVRGIPSLLNVRRENRISPLLACDEQFAAVAVVDPDRPFIFGGAACGRRPVLL